MSSHPFRLPVGFSPAGWEQALNAGAEHPGVGALGQIRGEVLEVLILEPRHGLPSKSIGPQTGERLLVSVALTVVCLPPLHSCVNPSGAGEVAGTRCRCGASKKKGIEALQGATAPPRGPARQGEPGRGVLMGRRAREVTLKNSDQDRGR